MLHSFLHYTLAFSQLVSLVSLALGGMASPSNPNLILDPADPNPTYPTLIRTPNPTLTLAVPSNRILGLGQTA